MGPAGPWGAVLTGGRGVALVGVRGVVLSGAGVGPVDVRGVVLAGGWVAGGGVGAVWWVGGWVAGRCRVLVMTLCMGVPVFVGPVDTGE